MADGAMCVGTATEGCATPDHATGCAVLVATDGIVIVGSVVGD